MLPCDRCKGTGQKETFRTVRCDRCRQKGWIETTRGAVKVCPTCEGLGTHRRGHMIKCRACDGTAYLTNPTKVLHRKIKCSHCEEGKTTIYSNCKRCNGSGIHTFEFRPDGSLRACSPAETHQLNQVCASCANQPSYQEVKCPSCHGRGNFDISSSIIYGFFERKIIPCEVCNGTGMKFNRIICETCRNSYLFAQTNKKQYIKTTCKYCISGQKATRRNCSFCKGTGSVQESNSTRTRKAPD